MCVKILNLLNSEKLVFFFLLFFLSVKINRHLFQVHLAPFLPLWVLGCLHFWISILLLEDRYVSLNTGNLTC